MPMEPKPEIASAPLRTSYGDFTLYVFSWSDNEQDNVLVLTREPKGCTPLIRIQSACYTGEIFASLDCDCHWQLETSLRAIEAEGGALIYMLRDGRGAGVLAKVRGLQLSQDFSVDTAEAYERLGIPPDPRDYGQAIYVLQYFGWQTVRLLTNNPRKVRGIADAGFDVTRLPLESEPTLQNRDYLKAKAEKLGHMLRAFTPSS
jgi:GTP cyclohydrolase II